MARCSNCNAPLPPGSLLCSYCGNRTDIDLKGIHYYTTHESETPRVCPRCSIALETLDLQLQGRFLIDRCEQCLGIFFDPGELEALLEATVSTVSGIDRAGLEAINEKHEPNQYPVSYLKCPVCTRLMNRVNFGAKSGVIVDRCKQHGVWLDGGELRQLFEWMKLGGQLLEQERRERQQQETEQREKEERLKLKGANEEEPSLFGSYSDPLRHADPDLFSIIIRAIRFFR